MGDSTEYMTFRYSIIKESQMHMYAKELPEIKGAVIFDALQFNQGDREFQRYGVNYSFIGFHYVQPQAHSKFDVNRYLVGKFAKLKRTETGVRVPGNILSQKQDDWIGATTVVDTFTQHLFVEKNWKLGKTEQIEKALNFGISKPILDEYNCKVFVKGKTDENIFWEIVRESTNIYNLHLKMVSPNILETNKKAREALKDLQDVFKQDEIDFTLKNDSGDLQIPIKPIADYVDYISEGEGSWKITSKGYDGPKRTHSSLDNIQILEIAESEAPEVDIPIPQDEKDAQKIRQKQKKRDLSLIELVHVKCREFHD
ncbi:MAG: hypothetical protein WBB19_02095 [Desulforhopalus sp.]